MKSVIRARRAARLTASIAAAGALGLAAGATHAQSAGQLFVKLGVNHVMPQVKSGDLSPVSQPGTKIDVEAASSAILTATYMVTDQFSIEAFGGLPYEHNVVGDGTIAGVGKIGSVKQVSPTVTAQYRFAVSPRWRPYVGLGVTYAYFYGEEGSATLTALTNPGGAPTRMQSEDAWGVTSQIGTQFKIDNDWYLDASVLKTFIKNRSTLSTGQSIETKLDPLSIGLSVGHWF